MRKGMCFKCLSYKLNFADPCVTMDLLLLQCQKSVQRHILILFWHWFYNYFHWFTGWWCTSHQGQRCSICRLHGVSYYCRWGWSCPVHRFSFCYSCVPRILLCIQSGVSGKFKENSTKKRSSWIYWTMWCRIIAWETKPLYYTNMYCFEFHGKTTSSWVDSRSVLVFRGASPRENNTLRESPRES